MKIIFFLFPFCLIIEKAFSQDDPCHFKIINQLIDSLPPPIKNSTQQSLKWAWQFAAIKLDQVNSLAPSHYKISLSENLNARRVSTNQKCETQLELSDETAFNWFIDSLSILDRDAFSLKWAALKKSSNTLRLDLNGLLQTRKSKGFSLIEDSIGKRKIQSSGFLSPGIYTLNGGVAYTSSKLGTFEIGFASARISWIQNKSLYDLQKTIDIAGVPRNNGYLLEGGISMQSQLEYPLLKQLRWENRSNCFYPISRNGNVDVQFKNTFYWSPAGSIKAILRTAYSYNSSRWPPGMWTAEVSLGYVFEKSP